jgi:hypothetical protein
VLLMTAYSAGLRVGELVNLKIARDLSREARQGREVPLSDPVSEPACGAAPVLETLPASDLAFPQPGQERSVRPRGSLAHLALGEEKSRA